MSEAVSGPRMSAGVAAGDANKRDGVFQFPALAAAAGVALDLTEWQGAHIRIRWKPTSVAGTLSDVLYYGFFATLSEATAADAFDLTAANADDDDVSDAKPDAPDWLEPGSTDEQVPPGRPFLRLQPAVTTGRCIVRHAEG